MIFLASDHRGFEAKEKVKAWLTEWGYEFRDCGPASYNGADDYVQYVAIAAEKVSEDPVQNRGIVLGATGQGEAMVANRRRGVRAAVYYGGSIDIVRLSRLHNASNILSLGVAPGNTIEEAVPMEEQVLEDAVKVWLETEFTNDERHVRRIGMIDPL
jgi:ribose 5-phosphate isomerase B